MLTKFSTLPDTATYLAVRRNGLAAGATLNQYQVSIDPAGTAILAKTVANVSSNIGLSKPVAAGDVVALCAYGSTNQLWINGVVVDTVTDASVTYPATGAYAGIRLGTAAITIDDFALYLVS